MLKETEERLLAELIKARKEYYKTYKFILCVSLVVCLACIYSIIDSIIKAHYVVVILAAGGTILNGYNFLRAWKSIN